MKVSSVGFAVVMVAVCFSGTSSVVLANPIFSDDFEDGDLDLGTQWYLGGTDTGVQSASIVTLNSLAARAYQKGGGPTPLGEYKWGTLTIGRSFDYDPDMRFSFEMQPSATTSTFSPKGFAGVDFSFNNALSIPIDSLGLMYATYTLPTDRYQQIPSTAYTLYSFSVADLMSFAGMSDSEIAQVRSISMQFTASAQRYQYAGSHYDAIAQVDFDNVTVTPEPSTFGLLTVGGFALLRRRRTA